MILPSAGATLSSILSLQRSETAYARPPFDKARSNCGQLLSSGRVYGRQPCSAGSTCQPALPRDPRCYDAMMRKTASAWSVSESTLSESGESGESGGGAWRRASQESPSRSFCHVPSAAALRLAWRLLGASRERKLAGKLQTHGHFDGVYGRLPLASSSPCSPRRMGTARHTLRRAERGECTSNREPREMQSRPSSEGESSELQTCLQLSGCTLSFNSQVSELILLRFSSIQECRHACAVQMKSAAWLLRLRPLAGTQVQLHSFLMFWQQLQTTFLAVDSLRAKALATAH